jgi:hypothetical protein
LRTGVRAADGKGDQESDGVDFMCGLQVPFPGISSGANAPSPMLARNVVAEAPTPKNQSHDFNLVVIAAEG